MERQHGLAPHSCTRLLRAPEPPRTLVWLLALLVVLVGGVPDAVFAQAGGLTALPPSERGPNLVENPGFEAFTETKLAAWRVTLDATLWAITEPGRSGRGSLRLSDPAAARFIPSADQVVTLEPGFYTIEGWVRTETLGGTSGTTGVRICLDGRPRINWWHCTPIASGTTGWTRLERQAIPVEDRGPYRVVVGAYGRAEGRAWFDDVALTRVQRPPLEAFLLYPNYRGLLFDDRSQTVRLALAAGGGDVPKDGRVRVALLDEETQTVKVAREYPISAVTASRFVAELDASGGGHGDLLLRASVVDAAGREVFRHPDHRIVKTSAATREKLAVWYDEANVTHLRGKPAFVLGLYTTGGYATSRASYAQGQDGWGVARMAEAPINMLINYWLGAAPVPALGTYMDELLARGIHYLQTVNFYYEDDPKYGTVPYPAARDGEDALNRWVGRTLGAHRGLAGFYTADERPADMVPKVFRQHRELRRAAPGTVTYGVLGNGWERQAPLWRDAVDVLGLDPYPITKPRGENDLAMVGEWTRLGRAAVMDSRPVWMVLQYFPLTRVGGWPTREELRAMSWMAIVDGARGLFYWSFGARGLAWVKDPRERAARWQDLVAVTKEIKALEPVLVAPDAQVLASESSGGTIRSLGKRMPDGSRYLFAYNTTGKPTTVTWTLADATREILALDPEPLAPTLGTGTLAVAFGPYEVKRYRLR